MPSPQIRPALLIARDTGPLVMAAAIHASTVRFTHVGIGTVADSFIDTSSRGVTREIVAFGSQLGERASFGKKCSWKPVPGSKLD